MHLVERMDKAYFQQRKTFAFFYHYLFQYIPSVLGQKYNWWSDVPFISPISLRSLGILEVDYNGGIYTWFTSYTVDLKPDNFKHSKRSV